MWYYWHQQYLYLLNFPPGTSFIGGRDIEKIYRRYPISDIRHRQSLVRYRKSICRTDCILVRYRIILISTELNPISDTNTKGKNRQQKIFPLLLKNCFLCTKLIFLLLNKEFKGLGCGGGGVGIEQ
jgi:hypothetical protein